MSSIKRPIDDVAEDTKAEEEPAAKKAAQEQTAGGSTNSGAKQDDASKTDSAAKGDDSSKPTVVEEGRLAFFYRPKVEMEEAHSVDDVQRFYMLMSPSSRPDAPHRLIAVGKKRLPKTDTHERFFGFVTAVDKDKAAITSGLHATTYDTKTRGTRHTGPARAAGEAWYEIVLRDKADTPGREATSLAYRLEVPDEPGKVQRELGIAKQASLQIRLKNPDLPNPPNAGLAQKAAYKDEPQKKKQFGGYAWIAVEDPTLLDYQNAEMVLIGERSDASLNLGEAAEHLKEAAEEDVKHFITDHHIDGDEHDALIAKLREEVNADQEGLPTEPAATGEWK